MSGCVLKSVLASAKFGKRSECRDEMSHKPRSLNSAHQALKPIIKVQRHTHTHRGTSYKPETLDRLRL